MNVLFHYDAGPALTTQLETLAASGLQVTPCAADDDVRFCALLADSDVLWHVLKPVTAAHIAAAPNLKLIQKIGVGVNTIDLEAAQARAIAVCNMPGTNSRAVAEMTLLLILAALRRLPQMDAATRSGQGWALDPSLQDAFGEIGGRTIGLVGFGGAPEILAPILTAFGATVVYTAQTPKDVPYAFLDLDTLLREADIVSLHIPETAATKGLLNAARLATMKPGAVLINTARGGLVDEAALADALTKGPLRAAGLDVFAHEPASADNPLFALSNVVVAPHLAWLTPETLNRSLAVAADNCTRLTRGEALLHRVV
jgi:phosphoglycerate dehydrogenase-like enzyme